MRNHPANLSPTERRALEAIDLQRLLGRLRELIAIESVSGRETPAQQFVATQMRAIGLDVDEWPIDMNALRAHPSYTAEVERIEPLGVVGRFGSGDGPTLILNGHVDVVPAGELDRWTTPPFEMTINDDRIHGRGSADMKGAVCCALAAAEAITSSGIKLPGTLKIQSVVGEEDGGMGTLAAVLRGHTGDAAIVLEPTELMVAPAQAGAMNFRITIPGVAAHGALRTEGVDPIERFIPVFEACRAFEAARNEQIDDPLFRDYDVPYALCIGTLRAGVWASTVAESLVCEGRLGLAVGENPDTVRADFASAIHEAAQGDDWLRDHPPVLEWWGGQFMPAAIPADHAIVRTVADAHVHITGTAPAIRGMPYGADMRLLVNEGKTPTVLYGPGDVRRAHAPNEFVPLADLETATRVLVLTILRTVGSERPV